MPYVASVTSTSTSTFSSRSQKMTALKVTSTPTLQVTATQAEMVPERRSAMQIAQLLAAILISCKKPNIQGRSTTTTTLNMCKGGCNRYVFAEFPQLEKAHRSSAVRRNCDGELVRNL